MKVNESKDNRDRPMSIEQQKVTFNPESVEGGRVRLDRYLRDCFPDYSRTYLSQVVSKGHVFVNEKAILKGSYVLKEHAHISIAFIAKPPLSCKPVEVPFDICAQEKDFLVINKPAGLLVHPPAYASEEPTLVHGLLYKFQEIQDFEDTARPGIVHRLDRDTSGLIIVARHDKAHLKLSRLFKDRCITKKYLALVSGHPAKEGTISFPIARSLHTPKKMTHTRGDGKPAMTHYRVLRYYDKYSLVEARPVSGRTHQIRVHFAAIGHSLVGDSLYGKTSKLIKRHALHAWQLAFEFDDQIKKYLCFVPDDFRKLLKSLL